MGRLQYRALEGPADGVILGLEGQVGPGGAGSRLRATGGGVSEGGREKTLRVEERAAHFWGRVEGGQAGYPEGRCG